MKVCDAAFDDPHRGLWNHRGRQSGNRTGDRSQASCRLAACTVRNPKRETFSAGRMHRVTVLYLHDIGGAVLAVTVCIFLAAVRARAR